MQQKHRRVPWRALNESSGISPESDDDLGPRGTLRLASSAQEAAAKRTSTRFFPVRDAAQHEPGICFPSMPTDYKTYRFYTWCRIKAHTCSWSCLGWMSGEAAVYFVAPISCRLLHKPNWVILGLMYFLPQICLLPAAREVPVRVRPVSNSLWINVSAYFSPHVKEGAWELPPKKKGDPPGRFLGQWCLRRKLHIYVRIWAWVDCDSKY